MSDPFIGEIRMVGCNFAPSGWMECDGSLVSIAENTALFALLGTTYGGDGQTTFALPDLRGRLPVHQGQAPGLSPYTMGQRAGAETVALTAGQMPAHTHALQVSTAAATSPSPSNAVLAAESGDPVYAASPPPSTQLAGTAVGIAGASQPHENCMPTLPVLFVIAVQGIFPPRP